MSNYQTQVNEILVKSMVKTKNPRFWHLYTVKLVSPCSATTPLSKSVSMQYKLLTQSLLAKGISSILVHLFHHPKSSPRIIIQVCPLLDLLAVCIAISQSALCFRIFSHQHYLDLYTVIIIIHAPWYVPQYRAGT